MTAKVKDSKAVFDFGLILLVTLIIYIPSLGLPAWDGNEPVRVIVAREMLKTGDCVIPVLHGKPYFVKPPLMNWLIAASGSLFGTFNEWTTRLPSVLISFMTGVVIYSMTAKWLSRGGRIFAAVATLSMAALIQKGSSAEIDSLFIFFVLFPLLIWINGYLGQRSPVVLWSVSLLLVGVGFLTKGPQAPAYFYLTVFAYLLMRKRLSFFFTKAHAAGVLIFVLVLVSYLFFVLKRIPVNEYMDMWIGQITQRAETRHFSFLEHFAGYPFRVIFSFMPWILFFLPAVMVKDLRKNLREVLKNEIVLFSIVMISINFPLYWLLPNARVRYFLPAGPFFSIILAGLFEFYLNRAGNDSGIDSFFKRSFKLLAWAALILALLISPVIMLLKFSLSLSSIFPILCIIALTALGIYKINFAGMKNVPVFIALITGLFFLVYTNLDVQHDSRKDNYPKKIAQDINLAIPSDAGTVYEIGYRRFLGVTCYINKEVIQLDGFSQLKSLDDGKGRVFFIFDTKYLDKASDADKKIFLQEIKWEKVYSRYYDKNRGEIVAGYIK